MRLSIIIATLSVICISCNQTSQNQKFQAQLKEDSKATQMSIVKVWETDTVLLTPESVLYDSVNGVIYVSNVNQEPWKKTGDGFISKLDMDGNVISLKWVEGMDSPKGMGIIGDTLFVADIDKVHKVLVSKGEIVKTVIFPDEEGLNDLDTYKNGVYVTSSPGRNIYKLIGDSIINIFQGDDGRYNGLHVMEDKIVVLDSKKGAILQYSLKGQKLDTLAMGIGHGDGIEILGENMLVSDWNGELFFINSNYELTSLLNTKEQKINSADIDYIHSDSLILVPTFWNNTIAAYKLKN